MKYAQEGQCYSKTTRLEGTIFFLMKIERKILVGSIGHSPGFQEIIIYRRESKHIKGKRGSEHQALWVRQLLPTQ